MKKMLGLSILAVVAVLTSGLARSQDATPIRIPVGQNALEFVGQFNNTPTTSQQFGYLSKIEGVDSIFSSRSVQNETTALFTFVTNATTDRVIADGPLKIINRSGTTTIYLNNAPSSFNTPASFSQGTPIQVSTYRQQVVLNTTTNDFSTVHMNEISQTQPFTLNGTLYRLGKEGKLFRTVYSGQVNAPGVVPSGWFGGYAVGVGSEHQNQD